MSMPCGFLTGEATTDKLPSGDAKFKISLARPQQTTPFAAGQAASFCPLSAILATFQIDQLLQELGNGSRIERSGLFDVTLLCIAATL
jgi:hypothetical protein